jgi:hypothetical protein
MIVSEFITNDVPPLHSNDTLEKALEWKGGTSFVINSLTIIFLFFLAN